MNSKSLYYFCIAVSFSLHLFICQSYAKLNSPKLIIAYSDNSLLRTSRVHLAKNPEIKILKTKSDLHALELFKKGEVKAMFIPAFLFYSHIETKKNRSLFFYNEPVKGANRNFVVLAKSKNPRICQIVEKSAGHFYLQKQNYNFELEFVSSLDLYHSKRPRNQECIVIEEKEKRNYLSKFKYPIFSIKSDPYILIVYNEFLYLLNNTPVEVLGSYFQSLSEINSTDASDQNEMIKFIYPYMQKELRGFTVTSFTGKAPNEN